MKSLAMNALGILGLIVVIPLIILLSPLIVGFMLYQMKDWGW